MKENKILAWVNNHKKGLAISAGCAVADDLTVADLGRFGEELAKKVDGITFESTVSAIMGFARK